MYKNEKVKRLFSWLKANTKLIIGVACVALLLGNFVVAQTSDGDFWDNTSKYLAEMLASDMQAPDDEGMLGAKVTDSTYLDSERPARVTPQENVWIEQDLEVGEKTYLNGDITLTDSSNKTEYFYKVIDFTDNTTTPVIWSANDDGYDDFYLMDMWIENTGKATSTPRVCVSTTTAGTVFAQDDNTLLINDAGACTLGRTFGDAFGADGAAFDGLTATSSMFSIYEYPGTDTRVANRINGFLINSTTDIFVRATSSIDYITGLIGSDTFDGKLHIRGRESDR